MALSASPASPGVLDEPGAGEAIPLGYRLVRGWALSVPPVTSVRIRLDGEPIAPARLGMPRPDVASEFDFPEASLCGFEAHLDLSTCAAPGEVVFDAEVTRADGSRYVVPPVAVRVTPSARPLPANVAPKADTAQGASGRKVLIVSHDLSRGGAQLRLLDYLRHMVGSASPEYTVLTQRDGPVRPELADLGVSVRVGDADGRDDHERYERYVDRLAALISEEGYDTIWANTLVSFAGVDAGLRAGVRTLWFIHEGLDPTLFWGPEIDNGQMTRHAYERCLVALEGASTVVCVADAARRVLQRYRRAPIDVLRNSVDLGAIRAYRATHDRRAERRRLGLGEIDRLILSCAPVVPHKGQAVLVQAFAGLTSAHPGTVLAMVGDIGHPYADGIRAYADRIGLGARLRIEAVVEEVFPWFQAADFFVLPSDDEALASVVLEAMAFEVPVVATDVAGMPEVVRHGETGFLCRSRDVFSLTRALDQALGAHPRLLRSMTGAAAALMDRGHDIAARAEELSILIAKRPPAMAGGKEQP